MGTADKEEAAIRRALNWLVSYIGTNEWDERKKPILNFLDKRWDTASYPVPLYNDETRLVPTNDLLAWYLCLGEAYVEQAPNYEFSQGARVIPILIRIGSHLKELKSCEGLDYRITRLVKSEFNYPDSCLFELLVATHYARHGAQVNFIEETPEHKTPDLEITINDWKWLAECKRLSKSSDYSYRERCKWLKLWNPVKDYLVKEMLSIALDFKFHVELDTLDDNYLSNQLLGKFPIISYPGIAIDNEFMTVTMHKVNYERINLATAQSFIKWPSSSMNHLILGDYDLSRGATVAFLGKKSEVHPFLYFTN